MSRQVDRARELFYAQEENDFALQLGQGLEHPYAVDCPRCDESKGNDRVLEQHLGAVSRADAAAGLIAEQIAASKERKSVK